MILILSLAALFSTSAYGSGKIVNEKSPVCAKVLNNFANQEFKDKASFIDYWQQAVDAGCVKRNPTLTTKADIQTNSKICNIMAAQHLPSFRKKATNYKKIYSKMKNAYSALGKKLAPAGKRVNVLMVKYHQTGDRKYYKRFKRILARIDRSYNRLDKRMLLLDYRGDQIKEAATFQIINIFTAGCLENKGFKKELVYMSKNMFYKKITNSSLLKDFSYEHNRTRAAKAKANKNAIVFLKIAKGESTSYNGQWPSFKILKKVLNSQFQGTNIKTVRATPEKVLKIAKENTIYITKLRPRTLCIAQLIYTAGDDKYFITHKFLTDQSYWEIRTRKNKASC